MVSRTTKGLRDILFDEIEELRAGNGDPVKANAVAHLAKQILNTARVEMDFLRTLDAAKEAGKPMELGDLELGSSSPAPLAKTGATGR